MDGKKKAKKMSVTEVSDLVNSRILHNGMFTSKFFDKKEAWRTVQETSRLVHFTIDQIKAKWNNLTKKYKQLIAPPTGGATENGEQTADQWVHFEKMHEFMSTQHTCYPPLVVNSNGDVIRNVQNIPKPVNNESGDADEFNVSDYIVFDPESSFLSSPGDMQLRASTPNLNVSPVAGPSGDGHNRRSPGTDDPELMVQPEKKRKKRYSQQDMFEYFRKESKRKRKESKQCLMLLKSIAESQNIAVPFDNSSSSDSDMY